MRVDIFYWIRAEVFHPFSGRNGKFYIGCPHECDYCMKLFVERNVTDLYE